MRNHTLISGFLLGFILFSWLVSFPRQEISKVQIFKTLRRYHPWCLIMCCNCVFKIVDRQFSVKPFQNAFTGIVSDHWYSPRVRYKCSKCRWNASPIPKCRHSLRKKRKSNIYTFCLSLSCQANERRVTDFVLWLFVCRLLSSPSKPTWANDRSNGGGVGGEPRTSQPRWWSSAKTRGDASTTRTASSSDASSCGTNRGCGTSRTAGTVTHTNRSPTTSGGITWSRWPSTGHWPLRSSSMSSVRTFGRCLCTIWSPLYW